MTRWAAWGYIVAAGLLTAGCGWFSLGLGLLCAGLCVALLTTFLLLDVGGDE